jgi:hypothetical protein
MAATASGMQTACRLAAPRSVRQAPSRAQQPLARISSLQARPSCCPRPQRAAALRAGARRGQRESDSEDEEEEGEDLGDTTGLEEFYEELEDDYEEDEVDNGMRIYLDSADTKQWEKWSEAGLLYGGWEGWKQGAVTGRSRAGMITCCKGCRW